MGIIVPGRNVWRSVNASRAAVLADGAAYFEAVRKAFLGARRSIFIIGWDIDSRTRLVGPTGVPEDRYPADLAGFLSALAGERPDLTIQLLLWDYSVLYSLEREPFPMVSLQWRTAKGVRLALDSCVPLGCSQHQKLVLVDDALAFSGGLDLTIRRWDTPAHEAENPHRVDPAGAPYRPFHDVQIMVDGAAARALGDLAKMRWRAATSEDMAGVAAETDPWPAGFAPDFTNVQVGIARTLPGIGQEGVREVEHLFLDSIATAEHEIYIENQFLTCARIADAIATRMRERPQLETLIVVPLSHDSWLAENTMRQGRMRFMRVLAETGVGDRVRLAYPHVDAPEPTDTMVHSKVMAVDDRFLRIGSANLNNRSMGTDTECDLAIEAESASHRNSVLAVRNRLLAEHCGVTPSEVERLLAGGESLLGASRRLSDRGHSLRDVSDRAIETNGSLAYVESIADPEEPLEAAAFISMIGGDRAGSARLRTVAKAAAVVLLLLGLTLLWQFTPVSDLTDPANLEVAISAISSSPWSGVLVVAVFLAGGLIAFPVNLLIAATAAAFGPVLGFVYAAAGTMLSAVVTYGIGAWFGRDALFALLGPRLSRIRAQIAERGILAVAAVRVVPVAPFTLVNVVAGASQIRLADYLIGTAVGMAPGLVVMSALGHQILLIFTDPSPRHFALLAAAIALWLALIFGLQSAVQRLRRSAP
jgi:phospholipase D1/2